MGQVCFSFQASKTVKKWGPANFDENHRSDAWKKPPPETFTASTVTKVAPGSKLLGNCGRGTMSYDRWFQRWKRVTPVTQQIRVWYTSWHTSPPWWHVSCFHRDLGINLHLPFLVGGMNPRVYMPTFILGWHGCIRPQSTQICPNNLKQKKQIIKGFLHHLFHTFLVLKHTVISSLQHGRYLSYLEPQTTIYKWLFQLDDSKSLHGILLEITKHPFINGCLGFQVWMEKKEMAVRVEV